MHSHAYISVGSQARGTVTTDSGHRWGEGLGKCVHFIFPEILCLHLLDVQMHSFYALFQCRIGVVGATGIMRDFWFYSSLFVLKILLKHEDVTVSDISQLQTGKYCMIAIARGPRHSVIHRDRR